MNVHYCLTLKLFPLAYGYLSILIVKFSYLKIIIIAFYDSIVLQKPKNTSRVADYSLLILSFNILFLLYTISFLANCSVSICLKDIFSTVHSQIREHPSLPDIPMSEKKKRNCLGNTEVLYTR